MYWGFASDSSNLSHQVQRKIIFQFAEYICLSLQLCETQNLIKEQDYEFKNQSLIRFKKMFEKKQRYFEK